MPVIRFLVLTENQAALVRGTTDTGHALDPRRIQAGSDAGKAVLPLSVLSDPAHEKHRLFLLSLQQANVDTDVAWPPEENPI